MLAMYRGAYMSLGMTVNKDEDGAKKGKYLVKKVDGVMGAVDLGKALNSVEPGSESSPGEGPCMQPAEAAPWP